MAGTAKDHPLKALLLAPVEIRLVRVTVIVTLVASTAYAGWLLLKVPVLSVNKTEIGMVLGWLVAKSGTAVDWLFGSSEGGARRADATATGALNAPPPEATVITPGTGGRVEAQVTTPADPVEG